MVSNHVFKVVFVGNANVGKTKMAKWLLLGELSPINGYVATLGVDVNVFRYNYSTYNLWDCGGDERFKGLGKGYYIKGDIFFIFEEGEGKSIDEWEDEIREVAPNATIHVVNSNFTREDILALL